MMTDGADPDLTALNAGLSEYALETFLAENICELDRGFTLLERQYRTDVGIIDLLAKDGRGPVIIELKIGEADDIAVAQVARYLGWFKLEKVSPAPFEWHQVRAILVAGSFTKGAECAAATIPDLTLCQFKLARLEFSFHSKL